MVNFLKRWWIQILAVLTGIAGVFWVKSQHDGKVEAEAELEHANYTKEDAVLAAKQQAKKDIEDAVATHAAEEKKQNLTKDEMVDYLRKL